MIQSNAVKPLEVDPARKAILRGTLAAFVLVVGSLALLTLYRQAHWVMMTGPNSVGEAGKVYFAQRVAKGQSIFVTGDAPPYYASMHGALLHASVGWIGAMFDLSTEALYGVGRSISVVSTVIALWLASLILRQLGAGRGWFLALVACFFCSEQIVEHAVSYRPDHWILLLSTACCFLLVAHAQDRRPWHLVVLTVIPPLAFFIKAPGMALMLPIACGLLLERRGKAAAGVAGGSLILLAAALFAVEQGSGGQFSAGLKSGMNMPLELGTYLGFISAAQYWVAWLMPIALLGRALPMRGQPQRQWLVVTLFFAFGHMVSAIASMRAGSNMYYFVDSFLYGMILTIAWFADVVRRDDNSYQGAVAVVLIFVAMYVGTAIRVGRDSIPIDDRTPMDISVRVSRAVGPERRALANRINQRGARCYSDDPGLNILLDKPQIIYPLMQTLMIRKGALPMDAMVGPIVRGEYDLVAMSGYRWKHMGEDNLPQPFIEALAKHYMELETEGRFRLFVPRRGR